MGPLTFVIFFSLCLLSHGSLGLIEEIVLLVWGNSDRGRNRDRGYIKKENERERKRERVKQRKGGERQEVGEESRRHRRNNERKKGKRNRAERCVKKNGACV